MALVQFITRCLTIASFLDPLQSPKKYIEYITENYFSGESLLFIYWSNVSMEFRYELMNYWAKYEIVTIETCNCDYVTDDIIWERSYVKNTVMLFGDMVPQQRHIESIRQCLSWNARSKVLAIVNDNDNIANVTLEKIWTFTKAINVTVMVSTMPSVKYYTSYPYKNFEIVELNQNRLFPTKSLDNLHGAMITIASTDCEPYVLLPEVPEEYTEGLEIRMINYMAKKYNFQTRFIAPPKGQSKWVVVSNGKVAGNLGLLYRCEADLVLHGLQIRYDRVLIADATAIHTIDSVVWTVPLHPFSFTWGSIIIVFQNELWTMLFSTLILIAAILYLITKYEVNSPPISYNFLDALFQVFEIYLYVPIRFHRERQLYRLFLFGVSYYAIVIVSLYQSSLITYLTMPGTGHQIDSIEEAVEDGLVGYFYPSARPLMNVTDHNLWNEILSPGRHVFLENGTAILNLVGHNKTAYVLMIRSFTNFMIHRNLLDEEHKPMVRTLPDEFLPYLVTIFTLKGHILRDLIQDKVMQLVETGITKHWKDDIFLKNSNTQKGAHVSANDDGPMPLTLEQLKGAFYMCPFLLMIAGMVFIGEVVHHWWTARKKRRISFAVKIWNVTEDVMHARDKCISKREFGSSKNLYLECQGKRKYS